MNKGSFKVGSLDQLMELIEVFQKYEVAVTATCFRAEKLFNDMQKDAKGNAELRVIVGQRVGDYFDQGE